jgi:hypothetical protein
MHNKRTFFTILLVLALFSLRAQKYSNEFLAIGVGARAHGMSGAQVALCDDVSAAYWNPAGLAHIKSPLQFGAMHAEWFGGVGQYDYLSFGKSLNRDKSSYLAFSLIRFGIDQIPYTINLVEPDGTINYDNVTEFSAADYAFLSSYARKMKNPALSIGGSFKIVRRVIGTFGSSWGFGADFGVQYRKGNLLLGAQGRDITTTFNTWSFTLSQREKEVFAATGNEIPVSNTEITRPRIELGGAYKIRLNKKSTLTPAADLVLTTDGQRNVLVSTKSFNLEPRIGFEADYMGFVQLRAGVGNFQRVKDDLNSSKEVLTVQPNFGVGLHFGRIQLDYALTDIGNASQVQYSHIISLRLDFKEKKNKE